MNPLDVPSLMSANAARWPSMVIDFDALPVMEKVASDLIAAKARYQAVSAATGVPWPVIAVIHERESSQNWNRSIAQGDPWNAVSVHVPAGRGPFGSWEEAAIDALTNCPPYLSKWGHWDNMGGVLTKLELYNGGGYAERDLPSPYVWSRTDQYACGKYLTDGNFDANAVDFQEGCAALLYALMNQDATILADFPSWGGAPAQPSLTGADGVVYDTLWLQNTLNQLGARPQLKPDGGWGPMTMTALQNYQQGAGIAASGRYNVPTLDSLVKGVANLASAGLTPSTTA